MTSHDDEAIRARMPEARLEAVKRYPNDPDRALTFFCAAIGLLSVRPTDEETQRGVGMVEAAAPPAETRYLTATEQKIMHKALRRSTKLVEAAPPAASDLPRIDEWALRRGFDIAAGYLPSEPEEAWHKRTAFAREIAAALQAQFDWGEQLIAAARAEGESAERERCEQLLREHCGAWMDQARGYERQEDFAGERECQQIAQVLAEMADRVRKLSPAPREP